MSWCVIVYNMLKAVSYHTQAQSPESGYSLQQLTYMSDNHTRSDSVSAFGSCSTKYRNAQLETQQDVVGAAAA